MRTLKEAGVDTSQTSISRSYFILIGLETYFKARRVSEKYIDNLKKDITKPPKSEGPTQSIKKGKNIKS